MNITVEAYTSKADMYACIKPHIAALLEETKDPIAILANTSAILKLYMEDLNWVGFYLMKDGALTVGPFQGKPAVAHIAVGSGVCGTCVLENRQQRVDNVAHCCNHIACDFASVSEIVTPVYAGSRLYGVLDIDSPVEARFDADDEKGLREIAEMLGRALV